MSDGRPIAYKSGAKTIGILVHLFKAGELNLKPGFQRQSVWNDRDRKKLIDSIIRGYPLPAIFLYRRSEEGDPVLDVIDGKQRLETILMFMREMRGTFQVRTQLPGSSIEETVDWKLLKKRKQQNLISNHEIPVIEVNGELGDIIHVFVRINSTGKALTQQEKRHARYSNTPLLTTASTLARKFEGDFRQNGVFSAGQINRMKHIEFICELMLSLLSRDVLNKKAALDRVMAASPIDGRQLSKAKRMITAALKRTWKMFPQIKSTRFRQITDFIRSPS